MKAQQKGMTLIELVLSIVIISIALLGTLLCINTAVFSSSDPILTEQAIAIADAYMQEILSKSFPANPLSSCATGLTRLQFVDICSYNALNQAPTDRTGTLVPGLGAYTVAVTVNNTTATLGSLSGGDVVARVDVRVSHVAMNPITLSAYVTND